MKYKIVESQLDKLYRIINEEIEKINPIHNGMYYKTVFKGDVPNDINLSDEKVSFFTTDKSSAENYTYSRKEQGGKQDNVTLEAKLKMSNPLIINATVAGAQNLTTPDGNSLGILGKGNWAENVKNAGYDGIIINKHFGNPLDGWEVIVFNYNQIIPVNKF